MAKRLTDSNKWQDAWFMDLPSKYKLFWLYLLDTCDHAGIWKVNFKVAAFHIGEHLEPSEVKRILIDRLNIISDQYWQIKKFIDFQYGGVKNDAVGKSVQKILESHKIQFSIAPTKGLDSPYQGTKDKDKDKDKDSIHKETEIRDFDWYKNQIDSIFIDQLPSDKKQNLEKALNESWLYLMANPIELKNADSTRCKRLLTSWLSRMQTPKEQKNRYKI